MQFTSPGVVHGAEATRNVVIPAIYAGEMLPKPEAVSSGACPLQGVRTAAPAGKYCV